MSKPLLILIGGGGHCRSCIDVIEMEARFSIKGILDDQEKTGQMLGGYPILGDDELIGPLNKDQHLFLVTVGQIKSPAIRVKIFEQLKRNDARLATVVSSLAYVSYRAIVGEGTVIFHGSVINAGSHIGSNNIINSMALIEHDVQTGNHVHISTGALINGGCIIGDRTFIGSGVTIANGVQIAQDVVIGAGAVVIKHILEAGVYAGNPCKKIKA